MFSKKFVMMRKNINANSYEQKACAIIDVKLQQVTQLWLDTMNC